MRASAVVKRQRTAVAVAFLVSSQAATPKVSVSRSGNRRFRHWPDMLVNSISATVNQLPCFGVSWNSGFAVSRLASAGSKAR